MTIADTDNLRCWLLHQLAPAQAEALEERLFADDATQDGSFAAALREAEQDLIDDYASGRLDATDRVAVERHLLQTAQDRSRLAFARALARKASGNVHPAQQAGRRRPVPAAQRTGRVRRRRVLIGAALAASFALALFVLSGILPHTQVTAPDSMATTAVATQTLTLLASAQRGANEQEIRIARGAQQIRLQAEVAQPRSGEYYELRIAEGAQTLFAANGLPLRQTGPYSYVEVTLPVNQLGSGARQISVQPQGSAAAAFVWNLRTTFDP